MLYLRSFATPDTAGEKDPDVWLFHKNEGDPFRTSISNVAVEAFLYSPISATGERILKLIANFRDLRAQLHLFGSNRSEERRVGKECRL